MSRKEFMAITPRFFSALIKAHHEYRKQQTSLVEIMLAQLTAMVANTGFKGWEEPRTTAEFMPSEWEKRSGRRSEKRLTKKQRQRIVDSRRDYWRMVHNGGV